MKVCVYGLWHLGSVTAAGLAHKGFEVIGCDPDAAVVDNLSKSKAPLFEPGLDALIQTGLKSGKLQFTASKQDAVHDSRIIWVAFDTPVDEEDRADIDWVKRHIQSLFSFIKDGQALVISSQVPVGSCRELENAFATAYPKRRLLLCYSPENLRLGKALDVFQNPDRIVAGIRSHEDRSHFEPLFSPLSKNVEWMSTESAEMTKHAINTFLALSVTFANEMAVLCESVGADAREVARGLLTESRIGPKAYLKPGSAFAGGTLARDVRFLTGLSDRFKTPAHLLHAILQSNQHHKEWVRRKLEDRLQTFKGRKIAVLGLTYKPGTDTLRRSWAVELSRWLKKEGALVQGFDWQVQELPGDLASTIQLKSDCQAAMEGCDGVVIGTEHPNLKTLSASEIQHLRQPLIVDPSGTLDRSFIESLTPLDYCSVGFSLKRGKSFMSPVTRRDVLLTGATGAIGGAMARRLARGGFDLHLTSREPARLEPLKKELASLGAAVFSYRLDLSDLAQCEQVAEVFFKQAKDPSALICNAGNLGALGSFLEVDFQDWNRSITENFISQAALIQHFARRFKAKRLSRGSIVVLSGAGLGGAPTANLSSYGTAKAAITYLAEALAVELKDLDITINAIAPGQVRSGITDQAIRAGAARVGAYAASAQKCKETGGVDPDLGAQLAEFLLGPKARGITGRLLSARFDREKLQAETSKVESDPNFYRLRRIDYDLYFPKS